MRTTLKFLALAVLVTGVVFVTAGTASAQPLPGAVFTTDATCTGVNLNIYGDKADVYVDGGPAKDGAAGLPEGSYYIQVTDPSGATVLGKSAGADVVVNADGEFAECYQLMDILYTASSGFTVKGYDDTPNAGGVYKVWISTVSTFDNDSTKTDNFKVEPCDPETEDCEPVFSQNRLTVEKFYDQNANGLWDNGDTEITGWQVLINPDPINSFRYTPVSVLLDPGLYTVTESDPVETNWIHTTPTSDIADLTSGDDDVTFGNVCTGAGGGLTLGFWSNKNGQALFGADDLALMVSLNLRNANGTNFDPASYAAFRTWLLSATATNMAYMLSAQLAAMELNVLNGKVNGNALIYAPGTLSANNLGFATVNAVMAEANTELGLHGSAISGDSWRTYQEALKNALDKANNNLNFVQSSPCPFSFAAS